MDGFLYYASYFEFLPTFALVFIFWSVVAVAISFLIWLVLKFIELFLCYLGWKENMENLLLFLCLFIATGALMWFGKVYFIGRGSSFLLKIVMLLSVVLTSSLLTWFLRGKFNALNERITPLVWLFTLLFVLSVPLVAYYAWNYDSFITSKDMSYHTTPKTNKPNIILVTFDALTARDMSAFGYERSTTPFISEWAKSASLFNHAEAEGNFTSSTVSSLLTGKRVWTHRVFHMPEHSKPVNSKVENLAYVLNENDYYTIAYVENKAVTPLKLGIEDSFDEISDIPHGNYYHKWLYKFFGNIRLYDWIIHVTFRPGYFIRKILDQQFLVNLFNNNATPDLLDYPENFRWFLSHKELPEPFFAWIHIMPPHQPYLPPEPYLGMFEDINKEKYENQSVAFETISEALEKYNHFTKDVLPIVNSLRARYDEFIMYCDKQFEELIANLSKKNLMKNSVIIVSSDHGESFEHDYIKHGGPHLYEQLTNIPLLIKEVGQTKGRVINEVVSQIDISATILELADLDIPSWIEGRSLVPLLQGDQLPPVLSYSMTFERNRSLHPITKGSIAVWEGDYKLIYYLDNNDKQYLLFNLKSDIDELENLIDKEPEIGKRLLGYIENNLSKINKNYIKSE